MKGVIQIVGGGLNQIPLIKEAKNMGLKVVLTDMFSNPPGKKFSDWFYQVNTTDKEGNLDVAKKHEVNYIVTDQTDVAVPTVAFVAEELGLKGIGYECALRFTNKYIMRNALLNSGIPHTPEFRYFTDPEEAESFYISEINHRKFVVKPINSQGSKGVSILTIENFKDKIFLAFEESQERGVLLEEFISGFEYSVEAFVQKSKVHNIAITKKYHYANNPCLDERNTYLGDVSPELEQSLFQANQEIIQALKLPFGITHAEYKISDGKVYLVEIAARGAGGSISSIIIPYLTGFNPTRALLNEIISEGTKPEIADYKQKFAVLRFFNFAPGIVRKVVINKILIGDPLFFNLEVESNSEVNIVRDSRSRLGYFICAGENRDDVLRHEENIIKGVEVIYN